MLDRTGGSAPPFGPKPDRGAAPLRVHRREASDRIDFALVNAIALDPVEWWRFPELLGAESVAAIHGHEDLPWWPGDREPVVEMAMPGGGALFLGLYTGRSIDARTQRWALDPVERLCLLRGWRPGQTARMIASAFGLPEVPRAAV